MGFSNEQYPDPLVDAFVDFAANSPLPVLDIGAGHGAVTAAAIKRGASVTAIDIHQDHFDAIRERVGTEGAGQLTIVPGPFPEAVDLPAGAYSAVLMARVLAFFTGPRIEETARRIFELIAPGGRVFISAETPFRRNMLSFHPTYEARIAAGDPWPGILEDSSKYFPTNTNVPAFLQYLDVPVLTRVFAAAGFQVEAFYYARPYLPEPFQLDGREGVGLIGVKPGGT